MGFNLKDSLLFCHGCVFLSWLDSVTPRIYTCSISPCYKARENGMKKEKPTATMERRYARLTARLSKLGLVLQGTITERTMVRADPRAPGKENQPGQADTLYTGTRYPDRTVRGDTPRQRRFAGPQRNMEISAKGTGLTMAQVGWRRVRQFCGGQRVYQHLSVRNSRVYRHHQES